MHRPVEGSDTKHSGSYTPELAEGIMWSLGHADLSSAQVSISHASDFVWDEWAAATPRKFFWEEVRDDCDELDVSSDILDVCIAMHDCCDTSRVIDVKCGDLRSSSELRDPALDEAVRLTTNSNTTRTYTLD